MNKYLFTKLIALACACIFHSAQASTTLTVELPNNSNIDSTALNSFFDVKIYADALPDFAGFDFNLTYNSVNLSALTITSGNIFGADTAGFASSITSGTLHFAEALSGTASATLSINAPTLLAIVHFQALKMSSNNLLDITNPLLYDFNGASLGGSLLGANIAITQAAVPLPASAFLFAPGLLALFGLKKNKDQHLAI